MIPELPEGATRLTPDEAVEALVTGDHRDSADGSVAADAILVEALRTGAFIAIRMPDGELRFTAVGPVHGRAADLTQHAARDIRRVANQLRSGRERVVLGFAYSNAATAGEHFVLGKTELGCRDLAAARRQVVKALTMENNYERTEALATVLTLMADAYASVLRDRRLG
jgi:hypothetical protein